MRRMLRFVVVAALVAGCNSDSFSPTMENVSGQYQLVSFSTSSDTGSTDWVAAGATLSISLVNNGVTTGHLFIPGGAVGGGDFNADMAGLWELTADTVHIDQAADSFVRDMPWVARENRLIGDKTFGDIRVQVTLAK